MSRALDLGSNPSREANFVALDSVSKELSVVLGVTHLVTQSCHPGCKQSTCMPPDVA